MGARSELISWSQIGPFSVTEARFLRQRTEPGKGGVFVPGLYGAGDTLLTVFLTVLLLFFIF